MTKTPLLLAAALLCLELSTLARPFACRGRARGAFRPFSRPILGSLKDSGTWLYVWDPAGPTHGTVIIDCRHSDSQGVPWYRR